MDYQSIRVSDKYDGQVCEVHLNAPPSNILNSKMMGELSRLFDEAAQKQHLKLIVLTGEGAHFSYGASVEEHLPEHVNTMLPDFHRLIEKVLSLPVPTLARVSGFCLGGGFELALACSFLMAEDTAKFAVPEIQLGVFPPVAAALLPLQASSSLTMRMILTGERVTAKELFDAGLVHWLCAAGVAEQQLSTFIEKQIIPKSASSLRVAHRAARMVILAQYRKAMSSLEPLYLNELMSTHDATEGIRSFVEKRPPKWRNA